LSGLTPPETASPALHASPHQRAGGFARLPAPAQLGIPARPARGSCALHLSKARPTKCLTCRRSSYLSRRRRSGLTSRNIGHQYSARGRGRRQDASSPGDRSPPARTSFMCLLFYCISFHSLLPIITTRPVFAHDRQETELRL